MRENIIEIRICPYTLFIFILIHLLNSILWIKLNFLFVFYWLCKDSSSFQKIIQIFIKTVNSNHQFNEKKKDYQSIFEMLLKLILILKFDCKLKCMLKRQLEKHLRSKELNVL